MSLAQKWIGAATATIVAVGGLAATAAAQDSRVFRSADTHADGYPTVEAVEYMGELLDGWTGGRLQIQVFPGRQFDTPADARTDNVLYIGTLLERPITRWLDGSVRYTYVLNASNTVVYDFDRHVVGGYLTLHY